MASRSNHSNSWLARLHALRLAGVLMIAAAAGCTGSAAVEGRDPSAGESLLAAPRSNESLKMVWRLYQKNDEAWPAARERWLAGPPEERRLLLDNLLIELLQDDSAGRGNGTSFRSVRARHELTWFGSEAVAPIVHGMRGLGSREKVDVVAIDRLAAALVELRATEPLAELAAPDPAAKIDVKVRIAAARALAGVDEPIVQSALIDRLLRDPEWQVRGTAAELLRKRAADPLVRRALHDALADADGFVRAQGVRALADGRSVDAADVPLDELFHFLTRDPAVPVRVAAAESLALYAFEPSVEDALIASLRDPEPDVVVAAARSLMNARTRAVQSALVDAFSRMHTASTHDATANGVWNELIMILGANIGARPAGNTPAAWRALIQQLSEGQ
ncbi:MAG: hypothetical protein EXS13_02085 [Planctomycetes bacterium]|nr:hypothetical protein [Planctomycetota bacterium]